MASIFSSPKTPKLPPPAQTPGGFDPSVTSEAEARRKKLAAGVGRQGTILTGLGGQQQTLGLT